MVAAGLARRTRNSSWCNVLKRATRRSRLPKLFEPSTVCSSSRESVMTFFFLALTLGLEHDPSAGAERAVDLIERATAALSIRFR
jgi:hypothetical protein